MPDLYRQESKREGLVFGLREKSLIGLAQAAAGTCKVGRGSEK